MWSGLCSVSGGRIYVSKVSKVMVTRTVMLGIITIMLVIMTIMLVIICNDNLNLYYYINGSKWQL